MKSYLLRVKYKDKLPDDDTYTYRRIVHLVYGRNLEHAADVLIEHLNEVHNPQGDVEIRNLTIGERDDDD